MITTRILPPKHLGNYIRFFWTLEFSELSAQDSLFQVFARKYPRMVFQHHEGRSGIYHGADYLPLAYLSGLNTMPYDCGIHPSISTFGVSFYPHAIKPIFGVDVAEIVNELPDVACFGKSPVVDQLLEAVTIDQKVSILSSYFTHRLRYSTGEEMRYQAAWQELMRGTDESQVRRLTQLFNLSERQLERRFKENLGLTPKQYLKINRFEKALGWLQSGKSHSLFDISYELGYADQSHFIREFRQFSGHTPRQYLKKDKVYDESSAFIVRQSGQPGVKVHCRYSLSGS